MRGRLAHQRAELGEHGRKVEDLWEVQYRDAHAHESDSIVDFHAAHLEHFTHVLVFEQQFANMCGEFRIRHEFPFDGDE
ncbi:hypothetical protein C5B85_14860 [Pseudoclavibacter sp. AY1F1]|nr:hypothetical protein C5B85_14860 [Pseudoclavibacter sp. AY1F1]